MDEYNRNNNDMNGQNEQGEQTTPFQTPVRDGSESGANSAGSQNDSSQSNSYSGGNPYRSGGYSSSNNSGSYNSGSYNSSNNSTGNPYSQNQSSSNNTSNKYSGWGPSPNRGNNNNNKQKKPKKDNKIPQLVIAALVIAVVGFAGGMAASGSIQLPSASTEQTQTTASGSGSTSSDTSSSNSTKMQISSTKSGENEENSTTIYQTVAPSIVSIVVDDITLGSEASGSGVIMSSDGYIITNQHVVADGNKYTVILNDSTQYEATLVGEDEQTDLAVLKIEPKEDLTAAEFGDSSELQVGDRCYAIGSPGGVDFQNTFTGGYISAIDRDVTINDRVMTLIQTDTAINPGSSGGALINGQGQVIGIVNSKLSSSSSSDTSYEGMGFAIPTSTVQDIVDQLIENGKVTGRPAIGISGYDISETAASYYDVPQGVLISSVNTDSDAYQQGVQANDIITAVNGEDITCMSDINEIKDKYSAGDKITLTIYRSGKTKKFEITLMDEADLDTSNSTANDSSTNSGSSDESNGNSGNSGYGYYWGNGYGNGFGY